LTDYVYGHYTSTTYEIKVFIQYYQRFSDISDFFLLIACVVSYIEFNFRQYDFRYDEKHVWHTICSSRTTVRNTTVELHNRYCIYDITILESALLLTTKTMTRVIFCLTGVGKMSIAFCFSFSSTLFSFLSFFLISFATRAQAIGRTQYVTWQIVNRICLQGWAMPALSRIPKFFRCNGGTMCRKKIVGAYLFAKRAEIKCEMMTYVIKD